MGTTAPQDPGSIFLVRHGETDWNVAGRCQGWTDVPLNSRGHAQAQAAAERFREHVLVRILSSTLERARQTAQAINAHHGLHLDTVAGLREINHGRLEGVPFTELPTAWPTQHDCWMNRPGDLDMPDGECVTELQRRATMAFESIALAHLEHHQNGGPDGHVLIVSHNLTISSLLCHLTGRPLHDLKSWRLDNCGHYELRHQRHSGDLGPGTWYIHDAHGAQPDQP